MLHASTTDLYKKRQKYEEVSMLFQGKFLWQTSKLTHWNYYDDH